MQHSSRSSSFNTHGRSSPSFQHLAGRYSVEERRERIDKYRSKRRHRNFGKRITYACRKRLADKRARLKGRFVSNPGGNEDDAGAVLHEPPSTTTTLVNNNVYGDAAAATVVPTTSMSVPEWWPEMQAWLACRDEISMTVNLHLCDANEMELIAAYVGVSSMDLCAYLHCSSLPPSP